MKISLALCTYNGAKYLDVQLASIAEQTRLPDEMIVFDDASNDETFRILEEFKSNAPFRVELHRNAENIGTYKNFESAISKCSGDIIALADQDDFWLPQKLKVIESVFSENPDVGVVFSDALLTDERLRPSRKRLWHFAFPRRDRKRFKRGEALDVLLGHNVVTGAAMAFRSELREVTLPFPSLPGLIHDGWISLAASVYTRFVCISEPLLMYRQHSQQQLGLGLTGPDRSFRERHSDFIEQNQLGGLRLAKLHAAITGGKLFSQDSQHKKLYSTAELLKKIEDKERFIEELIVHYKKRKSLPDSRLKRVVPIARELYHRAYHNYSRGFLSAIVDLTSK